jgi:hypothetical protein
MIFIFKFLLNIIKNNIIYNIKKIKANKNYKIYYFKKNNNKNNYNELFYNIFKNNY